MALVYLPAASEYLLRNVMSIRTGIANTQVNLSQTRVPIMTEIFCS
eukprot:COSAG01_NODE_8108_length_2917_cov_348.269340_3_plen_46_part_01